MATANVPRIAGYLQAKGFRFCFFKRERKKRGCAIKETRRVDDEDYLLSAVIFNIYTLLTEQ